MCGIVAYIGPQEASPILLEGLKRLEYRGYDSSGVTVINSKGFVTIKHAGKVSELDRDLSRQHPHGTVGIGHTRWATHGAPTDINAHPHQDMRNEFSLIHNGIIENYATIKKELTSLGYTFKSETDTEVLVNLIAEMYKQSGDFETAVRLALTQVQGTFGIAVLCIHEPDKIIAARRGSPLLVGIGDDEFFLASDASALVSHTRNVVYLNDDEMVTLSRTSFAIKTIHDVAVEKRIEKITFDIAQIEKAGYDHFMLKEIYEQPETILNTMRGRLIASEGVVKLGGFEHITDKLRNARRIIISACGTAWHAGLVGEYLIEQYARIPVEVEYASEFRYRNPIITEDDVVFVISQSGETADTLAAMREAQRKGATTFGIINVVGSTIARECKQGMYVHAGPEIGVASTKAFTCQITALTMIAIYLGRMRGLSLGEARSMISALQALPDQVREVLKDTTQIERIADEFHGATNALFLGRGINFPIALEGALKLKEISYIHAEGYPAAEMKHGPIALIDENMPVVVVAPHDETYEKIETNIQEVRARKGRVIAITTEGNHALDKLAEWVITIPKTESFLVPILASIPLQLLAYHIAVRRNCNVDQPRNLAKSVTVE